MSKDIFINKKVWSEFDENQLESYIDSVFNHYRQNGFPYFPNDTEFRKNELRKLKNYDFRQVIDKETKTIKQTMHGLALAWSFMPHSWEIPCNGLKTPMDLFNDDDTFRKVIRKRIRMGDNMSDNGIRKMLKLYTGAQSVSNFRPTAAAAIYSLFANRDDIVWDMSCGYGGRLLGAYLAGVKYVGTDPCVKTWKGLLQLTAFLEYDKCIILNRGSEEMNNVYLREPVTGRQMIDFAFTSPPYFDLEKYGTEENQSYIKFPNKEDWAEGFLGETFRKAAFGLKHGGKMAINIANTKSFPNLEDVTISKAIESGFRPYDTWFLALSNPTMSSDKSKFKYEPIFIFERLSE